MPWSKRSTGSFATAPVFGPHPRKRSGVSNDEVTVLDMDRYNTDEPGRMVKATWSAAGVVGLGNAPGLTVNLDPASIAAPVAQAGARVVADKIRGIDREIKPNTARYRATAARAYAAGKAWALKRYGKRTPGAANSTKVFNDSGELAAEVQARLTATNDWQIDTVTHAARNKFVVQNLLRRDIPELRSAKDLVRAPGVRAALGEGLRLAVSRPGRRSMGAVFGKTAKRGRIRK